MWEPAVLVLIVLALAANAVLVLGLIRRSNNGEAAAGVDRLERLVRDELARLRSESAAGGRASREELTTVIDRWADGVGRRLDGQRAAVDDSVAKMSDGTARKLDLIRAESTAGAEKARAAVGESLVTFNRSVLDGMHRLNDAQARQSESLARRIETLVASVDGRLRAMQDDNGRQLEAMRATVDEKLQGTLERRLGESFTQVSDRLAQVYRGLGEMQVLATGVGDLKKVLTNVKSRGTWGEVQLESLLEQVMARDQYEKNVAVKGDAHRVEFAIKFPGKTDDTPGPLWLPIDAKFPTEDYYRLIDAQERCDADAAETAYKALEARIKSSAKDIRDKYICPPMTTDFAVLFLPTEGLYAEVLRRTGLSDCVQRDCRVVLAGPTTLWAILSSLQMGFRTLSIQKQTGAIAATLAAVKTEWTKHESLLSELHKKLESASGTIQKAQTRSREIGKKLGNFDKLPEAEAAEVLGLPSAADGDNGLV